MNESLPREWSVGARSETGYARRENQDRMSRISSSFGDVYIVSDGMGGHKGGAFAAELTVKTLQQWLAAVEPKNSVAEAVKLAFEAANSEVYTQGHSGDPQTDGMGATAVVLVTVGSSALVAHVGDSRAYLYRKGRLQRLTTDHTRVQRMIDAGMLSPKEAETHPEAGVLERAIGHQPTVEVDVGAWVELETGDDLLLCSDGLCGYAEDSEIEAVLSQRRTPQELADDLVALSLAKGGLDNVTVQIVRYEGRMDQGRRRLMLYQTAFLPVVVMVSGATAYALHEWLPSPAPAAVRQAHPQGEPTIASQPDPKMSGLENLQKVVAGLEADVNKLKASPVPSPKPVPDPKISALEKEVASLAADVKALKASAVRPAKPPEKKVSALKKKPDTLSADKPAKTHGSTDDKPAASPTAGETAAGLPGSSPPNP